jgi:hypothetical protein
MRTGYRVALALLLTLVFSLCALALVLVGKEGYVPKPLQIALYFISLPIALLSLGSRVFPTAVKLLSGWVGFIVLQFAYCYGLVLLFETLFWRFRRQKAVPPIQ